MSVSFGLVSDYCQTRHQARFLEVQIHTELQKDKVDRIVLVDEEPSFDPQALEIHNL